MQKGKHPFHLTLADTYWAEIKTTLQWSGPGFAQQPIPDDAFSYDAR